MIILLLSTDLACVANVTGAATRAGHELRTAMSVAAINEKLADVGLVILDLNVAGLDLSDLVPWLRTELPPGAVIWAFGPHVHESKLAAAITEGCDRVLVRGFFYAQLDALLSDFA